MNLKFIYWVFVLFIGTAAVAQAPTSEKKVIMRELPVYRDVDVMASYRGGYEVVLKEVEKATKNCKRGSFKGKDATIVIDVLITDKGKVAKVDFVKADVDLCTNEIRSAVEKATQWIPARIDNKPVNSYLQLTINLNNHNQNSSRSSAY